MINVFLNKIEKYIYNALFFQNVFKSMNFSNIPGGSIFTLEVSKQVWKQYVKVISHIKSLKDNQNISIRTCLNN